MTSPDDIPSHYEEVRSFARRWAEGVITQAERYRAAYKRAFVLDDCWERLDDPSLPWEDVTKASEAAWIEGHLLVVAAHQMENWSCRLASERGDAKPKALPGLADLRNALEHMDQVIFEDGEPARDPASKRKNWALEKLPRTPALYLQSKRMRLLGLLDVDELEWVARSVTGDIIEEIEAPAVEAYIQSLIDERRGK